MTRRRLSGAWIAAGAATTSGVSVFVNGYGVHAVSSPAVYTTAKNVVATAVLAIAAAAGLRWRRSRSSRGLPFLARFLEVGRPTPAASRRPVGPFRPLTRALGLGYVGLAGGGLAFVLFFDGLADTTATPAAFFRDTLVVWVGLLGFFALRERLTRWNLAAIALLLVGQVAIAGGVGRLAADRGELLVLASTLIWAVEVVVAKVLLRDLTPSAVSLTRMGVGALALIGYLVLTGHGGALVSFDASQLGWILLTGSLLALYVGLWMSALANARAVDVTSVLVGSALLTALLQALAGTASLSPVPVTVGLSLVAAGTAVVLWQALRRPQLLLGARSRPG